MDIITLTGCWFEGAHAECEDGELRVVAAGGSVREVSDLDEVIGEVALRLDADGFVRGWDDAEMTFRPDPEERMKFPAPAPPQPAMMRIDKLPRF